MSLNQATFAHNLLRRLVVSNALRLEAGDVQPRTRIVGPRIAIMEKSIEDLDTIIAKLVCIDLNDIN